MEFALLAVAAVLGVIIGFVVGIVFHKSKIEAAFDDAQSQSKAVLEGARKEADQLVKQAIKEAKDDHRKRRQQFDDEAKKRRSEITKLENKIKTREQSLEKKLGIVEKREDELGELKDRLDQDEAKYKRLISDYEEKVEESRRTLQSIAGMSPEQAKRELVKSLEDDARKEAKESIRQIEDDIRKESDEKARAIVSLAVQRIAGEYVNDSTVSVVALPSDDMKGRIIGREGRNIRAIEQATGIDLIIDDTPEAVIISCFNPLRREVAKITLERLIADGRIHPARIEETARRVEKEFEQSLADAGEQAAFDIGVTDLHPDLIKMLGKLKYRTTGSQTVLQHSVETAHICGIMAGEMGSNVKKAKRAGLLHDIGKAADQEVEGHHAIIGADICAKYNESADIVEAIRMHHSHEISHASSLAVVLYSANALSSRRPGARREVLESYIKRLEDMETLVSGFNGVDQAYVLQAGKEVRALVTPAGIEDKDVTDLSTDIASRLRKELTFPGQVKVTVVRESRYVDYAK